MRLNYRHSFRVEASQSQVAAFHKQPAGLALLTPTPLRVEVHKTSHVGNQGVMCFTLWIGPLPVHWEARIENITDSGFTDIQTSGPFSEWIHRHSFLQVDRDTTEVRDHITVRLKRHIFWGPVGFALWLGLPTLFAFRAWKTRRLLVRN
jgi:ligand-binding SRPBCC domain-containing protein